MNWERKTLRLKVLWTFRFHLSLRSKFITIYIPQRIRRSHNDAVWKHKIKSPLTGCRRRLLRLCCRCVSTKRHISRIPVYYLYRLRAYNVNRVREKNGFKLAKARSRRYPTHTITVMDYANDIALIANTPAQTESRLHSLERAAGDIALHVNTDKTEYMCFNQRSDISILKAGPLKLVDKFTYFGSSVSSTENDISMRLAKPWTAIDRLSVIQ